MEFAAMIGLGVSILGLVALFALKNWEEAHERVLAPNMRLSADRKALQIKAALKWSQLEFSKLGPTSLRFGRTVLHDLALALASLSRASERQAHRLADLVSHKHAFQRREPKSDFLKQVSEVPMRKSRANGKAAKEASDNIAMD